MEVFDILKNKVMSAVEKLEQQKILPPDLNKASINVEKPKDETFGELSSNVAMVLSKQAGSKPRDLANKIINIIIKMNKEFLLYLLSNEDLTRVERS